jgi:hypothetical protein
MEARASALAHLEAGPSGLADVEAGPSGLAIAGVGPVTGAFHAAFLRGMRPGNGPGTVNREGGLAPLQFFRRLGGAWVAVSAMSNRRSPNCPGNLAENRGGSWHGPCSFLDRLTTGDWYYIM